MAPHSNILAWKIPRTEEPGGLQSMALQKSQIQLNTHTRTHTHTHLYITADDFLMNRMCGVRKREMPRTTSYLF